MRALDVAVIVDLDPVQRAAQPEGRSNAVEQLALRGALRQTSAERLAGGRGNAVDELFLVAALRHRERHPPTVQRQRLGHEILLCQSVAEQDQGRFRPVVVELADKGGQHVLDRELSVMAGK